MSCECCGNKTVWGILQAAMDGLKQPLEYCPVCGNPRYLVEFLTTIEKIQLCIPEKIEDENGKPITQIAYPDHNNYETYASSNSAAVDLDKIDVSREMKLLKLEKHDGN